MNKKHMKLLLLGILIIFLIVNLKIRENFYLVKALRHHQYMNKYNTIIDSGIDINLIFAIAIHRLFDVNLWHVPEEPYVFVQNAENKGTNYNFGGFQIKQSTDDQRKLVTTDEKDFVEEKYGIKVIYRKNNEGAANEFNRFMQNYAYFNFITQMETIEVSSRLKKNDNFKDQLNKVIVKITEELYPKTVGTDRGKNRLLLNSSTIYKGSKKFRNRPKGNWYITGGLEASWPNTYAAIYKIPEYTDKNNPNQTYKEIKVETNQALVNELFKYAINKIMNIVTVEIDISLLTKDNLNLPKSTNLSFTNLYSQLINEHEAATAVTAAATAETACDLKQTELEGEIKKKNIEIVELAARIKLNKETISAHESNLEDLKYENLIYDYL